jgi:mRNA (2'-O-methyladenosine-N6-)-methyltransferase
MFAALDVTGAQVMEFCPHGTKVECTKVNSAEPCKKLHFKKIIQKHTDESLGDCSFLNTCFHMDTCKYVLLNVRVLSRQNNNHYLGTDVC